MVKLDLGALQKINNTAILPEETSVYAPTIENTTSVENTESAPQKPKISLSKLMWMSDTEETNSIIEPEKIPEIKLEIKETSVEAISITPKIEETKIILTPEQEEVLITEEIIEETNNDSESLFIQEEEKQEEKEEEIINSTWKEFFPNFDLWKEFNLFDDEDDTKTSVSITNPVEIETPIAEIASEQEEIINTDSNIITDEKIEVTDSIIAEEVKTEEVASLKEEKIISTVIANEENEEIIDLNNSISQENTEIEPIPGTPEYVNKVKTDLSGKRFFWWIKSFNKKVVISTLSVVLVGIWIFGFMNFSNFWKINIFESGNIDTPPVLTNSGITNTYVEWVDYFITTTRKANPKAKKTEATNSWTLETTLSWTIVPEIK